MRLDERGDVVEDGDGLGIDAYDDLSTWGEAKVAQRVDARPRAAGLRGCKGFPSNPKW